MRVSAVAITLLLCTSCVTNVQQHVAFGRAKVEPNPTEGYVGDLVTFELKPPVAQGSKWMLECHGRARFASDPTSSALVWTAEQAPIRMETVISPWDPEPGGEPAAARGWLWYGLRDHGESEALDRELPVRRLPYRDLAPVTFSFTASTTPRTTPLTARLHGDRVEVTYKTVVDRGTPHAPSIDAKLVETNGKRILYAEVNTNVGSIPKDPIGYDVVLSYDASVPPPVEVVVVSWLGHGGYTGAFAVDRLEVDSSMLSDAPEAAARTATQGSSS